MRVVVVDGDVSYPATSGKRLRTLNLMLRQAERHQITYVGRCAPHSDEARLAPAFFRGHGIEPILVPHAVPMKSGLGFAARLAASWLSPLPYSVASHHSDPMKQVLRGLAKNGPVDLWQFEWSPYIDFLDRSIPGPRLVIAHNVDTLIWQRYYDSARGILRRAFLKNQWLKFERFEENAFQRVDWVVAVSPDDAALIQGRFGQPNVDVVDNGIDRCYFEGVQGKRNPRHVLFLGALDWRPNLDAVALLLDKIFPAVLAQEPAARLFLVGRNPPATLAHRVRSMANVELHADVPDVRPYLAESGLMTVPLRIGGGSRLKILEALACGLPVVSTYVGAEGLGLAPGQHYDRAELDAMATAIVAVMRDHENAITRAQRGRQLVLKIYDWDVLARKLDVTWEKCRAEWLSRTKVPIEHRETPCLSRT